jgi:transaldolase
VLKLVRPIWERTGGRDGYISIEEEADLAFEVEAAVARAHELRTLVDRPNVMVKVPGTDAGVEAFR